MKHHQIVIVGAGPVGLSLGLYLARYGLDVLVLEKNAATSEHSRAPAIWPRTQEILSDLGVIDDFLNEGLVMRRLEILDVDHDARLFQAPLDELADQTAYPHLLILPQSRTEKLLLNALQGQSTAEVRFSCEVFQLAQHQEKVEVRFHGPEVDSTVSADFVIGCDGAHSTTREAIGARLEGITYKFRAALADIRLDGRATFHSPRLTTRPRIAIGIQISEELWRLILPFKRSDNVPLDCRVDQAVTSLFHESTWQSVWQSEFSLHRRVSTSFAERRIVLAGDAAHLNSPAGGQGMNAGIHDAALLARALCDAVDQVSDEPLEKFGRNRPKDIRKGVNRFTGILTRMLLTGEGRVIQPVLGLANAAMHFKSIRRRILRRLAMLE